MFRIFFVRLVRFCSVLSFLILGFVFVTAVNALAVPTQWSSAVGGNDHWYEAVYTGGMSWIDSAAAAQSAGGHLVTITSEAERDFVFALVNFPEYWFIDGADNNEGPWIGAYYAGPAGTMNTTDWRWVTDEPWGYASWDDGEPNFTNEVFANFFSNDAGASNPIRQPFWNNVLGSGMRGYVVEWDAGLPTNPTSVGYNATWFIVTLASLILAGGYLLRRKMII